ncbi:glycoside hydrolase family 23 protein, partial [Cytidiella melzeri]
TESITETTGPNGSEDWLNCGITGSGWNPPNVHINDLVTKDLDEVMKQPNNPFSNCKSFVPLFNKYADQAGVPSIIIASFAMQESSCQPNAVGGAGEQGLMQITRDKCNGMSDSACRDPDYNIRTGAQYFSGVLGDKGGNVLEAIGSYNGWYRGLTKATVLKAPPCQQQNLDYLAQFTNGWLRGRNPGDSPRIGHIRNYDACNGA